jgi:predicted Zn-dependent protease
MANLFRSIILTSLIFFASCNAADSVIGRDKKETVTYSYACLDSAVAGSETNKKFDRVGDLVRDIGVSEKSITDEVQSEYGHAFHEDVIAGGTFKLLNDQPLQKQLDNVLAELLAKRTNPSRIQYYIYPVDDTIVNAFTFGGRIYLTKGMLKKCEGRTPLLYAIIGHEIGHSKSGHIKTTIQELKLSEKLFGDKALTIFQLKQLFSASTNQKNELEADYYGINLTNDLGYDVCTAVAFWKEMASSENSYSQVEDFFRTHPFSGLRAQCLSNHISSNFHKNCGVLNKAASLPQLTK